MSETFADRHGTYGVMAQFEDPEQLLDAANRAYAAGYRNMDAYTPMPIDGLAEAVGFRRNWVAPIVLFMGLCGAAGGFSLFYWISVIAYPHNVAGRPMNSWPAYIPVTFECTVLSSRAQRRDRDAGPQQVAHALSSGVQCGEFCQASLH